MDGQKKIQEYISKYEIFLLVQNGQDPMGLRNPPKSAKIIDEVKAAKPEIIGELKRQKEEETARKAAHEAAKQEMRDGKVPIRLQWWDGSVLSGYMPVDQATGEILEELGLAKYIEGWGLYVDTRTVETLGGADFNFAQASALTDSRNREVAKKAVQQEADRQSKFDEAKATGKPVLLHQWTEPCCDPRGEECSTDIHSEYAMPDGSTQHKWNHTF